jgi:anti-sigma B factor antagonist
VDDHVTSERRRFRRERVTWLVRLWLTDAFSVSGCAVNASAHGLWLDLSSVPTRFLRVGTTYRLQVRPGTRNELECWAVLRRVEQGGVALETRTPLPVAPVTPTRRSRGALGAVAVAPADTRAPVGVLAGPGPEEQRRAGSPMDDRGSVGRRGDHPIARPTISPIRIATERAGGVIVVTLHGDVDLESAGDVKQALTGSIENGAATVLVDLTGVTYVDSAGLGAIVGAAKRARASGATFCLCGLQGDVRLTFTVTGLITHLETHADREQALAALVAAAPRGGARGPALVPASA